MKMDRETLVLLAAIGPAPVILGVMLLRVLTFYQLSPTNGTKWLLRSLVQLVAAILGVELFWIGLLLIPESVRDAHPFRYFVLAGFVVANYGPILAVRAITRRLFDAKR